MILRLKNNKEYEIEGLREERLNTSDGYIWSLRFIITEPVTSDDIDQSITDSNISLMQVCADKSFEKSLTFSGYSSVSGASIIFDAAALTSRCAVQLSKRIKEAEVV